MHHFSCHGVFGSTNHLINEILKNIFICGGKLGVNVFVLITGYFLINGKFKIKKTVKIWFDVFFYTIVIYLISTVLRINNFNLKNLLLCFIPFSHSEYWFFSCYLILYILSPFLNKLIKSLSQNEFVFLIAFLFLCQTILPSISGVELLNNTSWFILLYFIGSYIKLYPNRYFNNKKLNAISFCLLTIIVLTSNCFGLKLWSMKSAVNLIWSLTMFLTFKNISITKGDKIITIIASSTFGIYLIHDSNFLRSTIWNTWFNVGYHYQMPTFIIFSIVSIITIFAVCFAIDYLKRLSVDKLFYYCSNKIENKILLAKSKNNSPAISDETNNNDKTAQ